MSPYDNLLVLYSRLQEKYSWRVSDIDECEIKFLTRQLSAVATVDAGMLNDDAVSIEDVIH